MTNFDRCQAAWDAMEPPGYWDDETEKEDDEDDD